MTRTMYDSVTATDIPKSAQMVAGYVSGRYRWSAADWARFPNAVKVPIATQASVNDGQVLDVEPGDAEPWQAPGWVLRRRASGVDPTVYCNELNGWAAVRQAFWNQHVAEPHYWVARYDGKALIPAGAVAKQYANPTVHGQGHYDLSIVADYWPGIDLPEPQEDDVSVYPDINVQNNVYSAVKNLFIDAAGGNRPEVVSALRQILGVDAMAAQLGELTDDEAKILAAIRAIPAGDVDEEALAAALAPLLAPLIQAGATPAEVEAAVRRVFASAGTSPT